GWKSKRIANRFARGFLQDKLALLERLRLQFTGLVNIRYDADCQIHIEMKPGSLQAGALRTFDNIVLEKIAEKLPPYEKLTSKVWATLITPDLLDKIFKEFV